TPPVPGRWPDIQPLGGGGEASQWGEAPQVLGMWEELQQELQPDLPLMIRTGETAYKCLECGKSFSHNPHFLTHYWLHTRKWPCKCGECGKNFNNSSTFTTRQKIHTEEQPYGCGECRKGFQASSHLLL
ncbi:ZSC29 protein, partial [Corvus moneduloides]|nr:ZSC29 protein [Corvus moneduloides]